MTTATTQHARENSESKTCTGSGQDAAASAEDAGEAGEDAVESVEAATSRPWYCR